jgi:MYXO-CTERM domain-containing protein
VLRRPLTVLVCLGLWGCSAGPVEPHAGALIGAPTKTRRWAFVLLDIDGKGNPIDKVNAQSVLFSPDRPDSIRSYFREVSYGVQDLEGEVFGPIPYQMGGRCDTDRLAQALTPQINGKFDQYLWFFGTQQAACDWAGIADLGRADRPTRNSWYNSFHSCTVLVQEPGHNFGMVHSSAMRCTVGGKPVPIAWPDMTGADCRHIEYGNPFDPMGGGDCFHMNGVQKAYQDWLGGCNVVKATESGTYTIYPLESACDGPQLLQIPFPQSRSFSNAGSLTGYYLELRAPVGYRDRKLQPQVLVMVANDVREARFTGNPNWLLDMTPETQKLGDEALPVGQRFEDLLPGGPKFTLLSVDATKAVVQVELQGQAADPGHQGKGLCSDMTDYQPGTPVKCVAPPTPAAPAPDGGLPPPPDAGTPVTPPPMFGPDAGSKPASGKDAGAAEPPDDPVVPPAHAASSGCSVAPAGSGGVGLLMVLLLAWRRRR